MSPTARLRIQENSSLKNYVFGNLKFYKTVIILANFYMVWGFHASK